MDASSTDEIYRLIAEEEFEAAESLCREQLEQDDLRHVYFTLLGEIYIAQGRSIEAQLFFEHALESEPEYARALNQLDMIDSLISMVKLPASHLIEKFNDGSLDHRLLIIIYRMLRETERKIEIIDGLKHGAHATRINWQTLWFFAREAMEFDQHEAVDYFCGQIKELNPDFVYASELPRHARGFYAYADYDEHIEHFFEQHTPAFKTFVEIGSFDGRLYSQVRRLYESFRWSGLCVEPDPENFRRVQRLYEDSSVQCANYFLADYNEDDSGGSVTTRSLSAILEEKKIHNYDFLCINTARNALSILKGCGLDKFTPSLIACKTLKNRGSIDAFLAKMNYTVFMEGGIYRLYCKSAQAANADADQSKDVNGQLLSSRPKMQLISLVYLEHPLPYIDISLRALNRFTSKTVVLTTSIDQVLLNTLFNLKEEGLIHSVIQSDEQEKFKNRNKLLNYGRRLSGTHFLVTDPDEVLSANLLHEDVLLSSVAELNPGESLSLKKVYLWNGTRKYFEISSGADEKKCTIAFADDGISNYVDNQPAGTRLPPGLKGRKYYVEGTHYNLIDLRYANMENMLIYRSWVQCKKLVAQSQPDAGKIVAETGLLPDVSRLSLLDTHPTWFIGYKFINDKAFEKPDEWRIKAVYRWFNEFGLTFFRDLDIWQVNWKGYLPLATSTPAIQFPERAEFADAQTEGANHMAEAEAAIRSHNLDFAEQLLAEILYNDPRNIEALNNLAIIKIMTEEYKAAEEILTQLLVISPDDETAHENLSYLQKMGRL